MFQRATPPRTFSCRSASNRDASEQIVGRERRERVSQLARCGEGCFDSRRRVNSTVRCYFTKMAIRVLNHAKLSSDAVARIAEELSTQENLKDVMAWALSQPRGTFTPSVVAE